jgi:hypothetical protein
MQTVSSARARLASFLHAYAVAVRLREATGLDQFVVRTGDPMQPFRVTATPPVEPERPLAHMR